MKKLIRSTGARITVIAAAGFGCFAVSPARADEWKAGDKAAAQLQPTQTFDGFSVRLPASAASSKIEGAADGKSKTYSWSVGGSGDKGGAFTISTRPSDGKTSDQILTEWTTQSILTRLDDVGKSAAQTGTVGTGAFSRLYYHGREKDGAKGVVHGFVYVGVAQNRVFVIESQDPSEKYTVTLPQNRSGGADAESRRCGGRKAG